MTFPIRPPCAGTGSFAAALSLQHLSRAFRPLPQDHLLLCRSGALELAGDSGSWSIPPGHMVLIPQGRAFHLRLLAPGDLLHVCFAKGEVEWPYDGCWVRRSEGLMGGLLAYGLKWGPGRSEDPRAAAFFTTLGEMVPGWFRTPRVMWSPRARHPGLRRLLARVEAAGTDLTLAEASALAGMSERSLRRRMQSELGQSWRDFQREARIRRAMHLLRRGGRPITDIALELGFASSSSFSTSFAAYVGESPRAFARGAGAAPSLDSTLIIE
ncbi:helix-turn-helix domain-containing protein [Neotabrizicola sp. VNH66]|uniref:helix-turn-helix domain-containing protein n=1 Tax=Neotabrizicola sp. VNH66 TaxID=3400918 RepID=UPI003C107E26